LAGGSDATGGVHFNLTRQRLTHALLSACLFKEVCIKAHAEFLNLATRQHSFAPDSADYLQQLAQLEAALSSSKEQFLDKVQAAATRIATSATAAML
jgi:hypothetical protein